MRRELRLCELSAYLDRQSVCISIARRYSVAYYSINSNKSTLQYITAVRPFGFFFLFSFFFHPIYYLRPFYSRSLLVVTQIRGHITGSSPPLPTTVRALHFFRENSSALPSSTRVELFVSLFVCLFFPIPFFVFALPSVLFPSY